MRKFHKQLIAAAGVAALGVVGITVAANAAAHPDCKTLMYPLCARSVAAGQVVDNSLPGYKKLAPGSVSEDRLSKAVQDKLNKTGSGTPGEPGLSNLEADGPYPESTQLADHPGQGANSDAKVPADGKSHTVWVECAEGKLALGGGFRVGADQGDAVASKIQVTASEPTQIADGKVVYKPIEGDAAGSTQPNGWLVEAINTGAVDATVRPWVTCATVAK